MLHHKTKKLSLYRLATRMCLMIWVLLLSACCTIPPTLNETAFKAQVSPEVHIPANSTPQFIPLMITNDSVKRICFERTGKADGLQIALNVDVVDDFGNEFKIERVDLSGLSGEKLKKGRSIIGLNSPNYNKPIGYYISANQNAGAGIATVKWELVVTTPKSAIQKLVTKGSTIVKKRNSLESYLLTSEMIPFSSVLETK